MKIVIVGGVAGGASTAARARRLDESAEIIVLEKDQYVSYANCGLPYHIGKVIEDRQKLLVQTPERLKQSLNLDVRVGHEVTAIDRSQKNSDGEGDRDGRNLSGNLRQVGAVAGGESHPPPLARDGSSENPRLAQHSRYGWDFGHAGGGGQTGDGGRRGLHRR